MIILLSFDIASGSEITPCNKINKPLVISSITMLCTLQNYNDFTAEMRFQSNVNVI